MNVIEKYAGLEYITLSCKGDRVSFNTALEVEKKGDIRLSPVNEVFFRTFFTFGSIL